MKKKLVLLALFIVFISVFLYAVYAYGILQKRVENGQVVNIKTPIKSEENKLPPVDYEIVEHARGLYVPWDIEFTSSERALITERNGNVREVINGNVNETPLIFFDEVVERGESGLMGLAKHPDYEENKYLYVCLTYETGNGLADKVERLVDNGESIARDNVVLDSFPAARFHAGCRIKFGPDKKLYITTGDATTRDQAQNSDSLAGKILRLNDDGTIPEDNPISGSPIYSLGHRNPQGIAWHMSGVMYSTEHGPSGNDGPGGGDEVNVIKSGANYGWPLVSHNNSRSGMQNPKLVFTPAEAPAGAMIYSGNVFPQFQGNLFFAALRGASVFRVVLDNENPEEVISYEKLDINFGRIRDIEESPDGLIYFSTSNRDGRGRVRDGDDKIFKIIPS